MSTTLGLEFANLRPVEEPNGWHIVNLTLDEVEVIRRALLNDRTTRGRMLGDALSKELDMDPRAIDMQPFIGRPIEEL